MTQLGVPCPVVVHVAVTASATHRCPFKNETDHGTVRIEWTTAHGETLELHALAALIVARADEEISHEQWTSALAAAVAADTTVDDLTVTSEWTTAGLQLSVDAHDIGGSTLKGGPTE